MTWASSADGSDSPAINHFLFQPHFCSLLLCGHPVGNDYKGSPGHDCCYLNYLFIYSKLFFSSRSTHSWPRITFLHLKEGALFRAISWLSLMQNGSRLKSWLQSRFLDSWPNFSLLILALVLQVEGGGLSKFTKQRSSPALTNGDFRAGKFVLHPGKFDSSAAFAECLCLFKKAESGGNTRMAVLPPLL